MTDAPNDAVAAATASGSGDAGTDAGAPPIASPDPLTAVLEALGILPPRSRPEPKPLGDDESTYQAIRLAWPGGPSDLVGGVYHQVSGDHLYVAELNSIPNLYVRVGAKTNPWVRLRRGLTIRRTFTQLTFKITDAGTISGTGALAGVIGDALLYASHGPMFVDSPPQDLGLESGFIGFADGVAPTGGVSLFTGSPTFSGYTQAAVIAKAGGTLILSNLDPGADLLVFSGRQAPGGAQSGWPLRAGRDLIIPIKAKMFDAIAPNLSVRAASGTVAYGALVAGVGFDSFDGGFD